MKSILITGAASGIGRASAVRFSAKGWRVGLLDRDLAALDATAAQLSAAGRPVFHQRCDVTDADQVRACIDDFARDGLDLLLISHGVLSIGRFETLDAGTHKRTIDINVTGNINCLLAAFPHLKRCPGAQVISLCSASAVYGTPDFASYSASKFAVRALTEALAIEWECHGIRVSDIWPPFVDTPMVGNQQARPPVLDRLGVTLTADMVADEIWRQAQSGPRHRPIGFAFRLQYYLSKLAPGWLLHAIYSQLSR